MTDDEEPRFWWHQSLDPSSSRGWIASYNLVPGPDGDLVIAEIRIFPAEGSSTEHGDPTWSGNVEDIPARGLPARLLRERLRPSEAIRSATQILPAARRAPFISFDPEGPEWARFWRRQSKRELSGQPRTNRLALVALHYVRERVAGVSDVNEAVARTLAMKSSQVRDDVYAARQEGLLSPTQKGMPGGVLTPKALKILSAMGVPLKGDEG